MSSTITPETKVATEGAPPTNEDPSFVWNSLPPKREGFGVLYCAYSKDTNKSLPKYFKEAATSAKQLKANNPTISTAIITNANQEDVPDVFDHIIKVKDSMLFSGESTRSDGIYQQCFSRIYYLAHSPFEVTWYVDSHAVFVTTELEQALREFEKLSIHCSRLEQPKKHICYMPQLCLDLPVEQSCQKIVC